MKEVKLKARKREKSKSNLSNLRKETALPGVLYGFKIKPILFSFDKKQAEFISENKDQASVFPVLVEGEDKERNVIIQELQYDKLSDKLIHIDLYEVDMKKEIETEVPLDFQGISGAVKDLGGMLYKNLNEVLVRCLPNDLPQSIKVNIDTLKTFEDIIHIKDLIIPQKVEIVNDKDEMVASVAEPRSEKEMEALDEEVTADVSQVEGVKEKEEEEEEEEEGKEGAAKPEAAPGESKEAKGEKKEG